MGYSFGGPIVTDGLVASYDAADKNTDLVLTDITAFDSTPQPPTNLQHAVIVINQP